MISFFSKPREEKRAASIENPTVKVSADNFLAFFGVTGGSDRAITVDSALSVPAVQAAVLFLSRTLAAVPLRAYRLKKGKPEKLTGQLRTILEENPNEEMDSANFRKFFWEQVFTGGRGLCYIERDGGQVINLWPFDPAAVTITKVNGRRTYQEGGKTYQSSEVIDVAFMLKSDGIAHRSPLSMGAKAISLALNMNDYGSTFFAGGGVPPLAVEGPMPANADAMKRAMDDINRAIKLARDSKTPIFQMPSGYKISQIGFDPEKGQMTEARLFQVQEIARIYQMPPTFLQDLSRATFSNVEQNDIHLVKHLVGQWCALFEGELNLKLFGRLNGSRYVKHDLDGLMRGDFKSLIEGIAAGIQGGIQTPNEGREKVGLPRHDSPAADLLHMQGATVPIGSQSGDTAKDESGSDDAAKNQD